MKQLTLYYFEPCPYCQKVLRFMNEKKITIPIKDIHKDLQARDELIRIGGRGQVPCLVIDEKALYESDDIIKWLEQNM